jgi:molybdate transport system regulatory protein
MARAKKSAAKYRDDIGKDPAIAGSSLRTLGEGLQIRAKAWITSGDETFLAHGRILLLEKIRELGSISAAARSIRMSYRRAWWHIETMNRLARKPLVETAVGGKGGGGTRLTPEGEAAVTLYRTLDGRAKAFEELVGEEFSRCPQ